MNILCCFQSTFLYPQPLPNRRPSTLKPLLQPLTIKHPSPLPRIPLSHHVPELECKTFKVYSQRTESESESHPLSTIQHNIFSLTPHALLSHRPLPLSTDVLREYSICLLYRPHITATHRQVDVLCGTQQASQAQRFSPRENVNAGVANWEGRIYDRGDSW